MELNRNIGVLTARMLLGFIFLMQGYGKVVEMGVHNVYDAFFVPYNEVLPEFLTMATAYYTSYIELIGGFLLILGLFRKYALYALASVLVIVTIGHGLLAPIWDLQHVMYRAMLLILLLLLPQSWDRFSLDRMLNFRN